MVVNLVARLAAQHVRADVRPDDQVRVSPAGNNHHLIPRSLLELCFPEAGTRTRHLDTCVHLLLPLSGQFRPILGRSFGAVLHRDKVQDLVIPASHLMYAVWIAVEKGTPVEMNGESDVPAPAVAKNLHV